MRRHVGKLEGYDFDGNLDSIIEELIRLKERYQDQYIDLCYSIEKDQNSYGTIHHHAIFDIYVSPK